MPPPEHRTVALIGSFRKHYAEIVEAHQILSGVGLSVLSPSGAAIIDPRQEFVRLESDPDQEEDHRVQTIAMRNILSATVVYAVLPGGYVGKTTCYEIGRIVQAQRPIYFSQSPQDLPLYVPKSHVLDIAAFALLLRSNEREWRSLYADTQDTNSELERRLSSELFSKI